jgi:hypothetical protein
MWEPWKISTSSAPVARRSAITGFVASFFFSIVFAISALRFARASSLG